MACCLVMGRYRFRAQLVFNNLLFVEKARCLFISVFIERQPALYYCVVVMSIKVKDMRRVPDFEVQEL